MMEAVRTSETSVDNYFTWQYIPEDNSEHIKASQPLQRHSILKMTTSLFTKMLGNLQNSMWLILVSQELILLSLLAMNGAVVVVICHGLLVAWFVAAALIMYAVCCIFCQLVQVITV
jgi:hypothetical protein